MRHLKNRKKSYFLKSEKKT